MVGHEDSRQLCDETLGSLNLGHPSGLPMVPIEQETPVKQRSSSLASHGPFESHPDSMLKHSPSLLWVESQALVPVASVKAHLVH